MSDGELENLKETEIKKIERESRLLTLNVFPVANESTDLTGLGQLGAVAKTFQPAGLPPAYWPKLLFIVVSKRCVSALATYHRHWLMGVHGSHHVRFFPE